MQRFHPCFKWLLSLSCITLLFIIIYHQYIFGDKLFMFTDIGFDTISIIHPFASAAADSHIGSLNDYSFQSGLGGGLYTLLISYLNPAQILTYIVPSALLPYTYILCMYISTMLAGIYGYRIGSLFTRNAYLCTIASILFAYSGYISLWGQQPLFGSAYSLMVVYTYYLLKCKFQDLHEELKLLLSLCLISLTGYYFLYMAGIFSALYLLIHGLYMQEKVSSIIRQLLHLLRAGLLAVLLCAFSLLPNLYTFTQSTRSTNISSNVAVTLLYNVKYLITDIARLLSSNLLRIGNDYTGAYNYYEGTILWCSLLSIMMLIFCLFFRGTHKKRIIFLLCTLALLFPVITKFFTFDATKQRWTFVYIIALICLCIYTLDDITEHAEQIPLKRWLLISDVIILLLLAIVLCFVVTGQVEISKRAFVKILFILFLYNVIFMGFAKKNRRIAMIGLLIVVCLDVVLETYPTANTRTAITKEEYVTALYNDGTKEAAADIQSKDLGLYRISKSYTSVFLNDAKVQQYNGTTAYTSVPSSSTSEYMLYNDIPFARDADYSKASKYISVPYDNYYINTLLGVKYLFIKDMASLPSQYTVIEQVGDIYVCQNNRPLSFGYLYHQALSHDGYDRLSTEQKAYAMTSGFYLTKPENESDLLSQYAAIDTFSLCAEQADLALEQLQKESLYDISYVDHELSGKINNTEIADAMLCLPIFYDNRWSAYVDGKKVTAYNINGGLTGISISPGVHEIRLIYHDPIVYVSTCISGLSIIGMAIYLLLYRRHRFSYTGHKKLYRCTAVILIPCIILGVLLYEQRTKEKNSVQERLATGETLITQYGYDSTTATQFSFWTIETADSFSIIDGGIPSAADLVRTIVKEHDNHVDNWIITHPHPDHMGAFNCIMQDDAASITIDHLYTVEFPLEAYEQIARDVDDIDTYYTFLDITQTLEDENILSVEYLHKGDILHLGTSQLKVYSEYSPEIVERNLDLPNSSSLVFKISGQKQSMLFFADFEDAQLAAKLYEKYGHELDATYIQLGHHGNNALDPSYYLNLHPSAVYADAPYFLYTGEQYKCKNTLEYLKDHDVACYTFHGAPHRVYVR